MTNYDSGTEANHMELVQTKHLGLEVIPIPESDATKFKIANGTIIKPIGRTSASISFANGDSQDKPILCHFNVFKRLAVPVLMGMKFLEITETLSKYRNRLVELPRQMLRSLRVCAMGDVSNEVVCIINGREVYANADTGSEIPLMRGDYARSRGIYNPQGEEKIMFADGSIGYTLGVAHATISLGDEFRNVSNSISTKFYIFEDLSCNVLLDEDLVDRLEVFTLRANRFFSGMGKIFQSLCPIRYLGPKEKIVRNAGEKVSQVTGKIGGWISSAIRTQPITQTGILRY
jgi:hypothetical protein